MSLLKKLALIEKNEITALCVSCLYFFCVLCSYYIFRSIRNEMVIANGVENVQTLYLFAMIILFAIMPLFGWITSRYRTREFMAICTLFFASNLVVFFFLFNVEQRSIWVSRAFFVWANIFNMFIVSLFWSFMNDIFSKSQSKRLFAFIAAGGTAGAITGPIITALLVEHIGLSYLLLISALVLSMSVICITWLLNWQNSELDTTTITNTSAKNQTLEGGAFDALKLVISSPYLLGICAFIILYSISLTFISIQQASLIESTITDPNQRTKLFASIDFSVNVIALILQLLVTANLIRWIGFTKTLCLIPLGITIGFAFIIFFPILPVMIALQVFRRSGDYAIMKPTREMLFTVLSRREKYKAKNFIDTAILRTGDTTSAWLYTLAKTLGAAGATIPMIAIVLGAAWTSVAVWLGGQYKQKQTTEDEVKN